MWLWVSMVVALLCAGDLSKVHTMSCPNASWERLQQNISPYSCLSVLAFPSRSLNQSLFFLLFPQLQTNWCSGWAVVALLVVNAVAGRVIDLPLYSMCQSSQYCMFDGWIHMIGYFRWDPVRLILPLAYVQEAYCRHIYHALNGQR